MNDERHPKGELIEAAWSEGGPGHLSPEVQEHLKTCLECQSLFRELKAARRAVLSSPPEAGVTLEQAETAVRRAMLTARVAGAGSEKLEAQDGVVSTEPTPAERVGFALLATGLLGAQAILAMVLRPRGFLILQGALNWMTPLTFYIIFRLHRRASQREEGSV